MWRFAVGGISGFIVGLLLVTQWKKAKKQLKGKKIAVLGPRAAGKTTLIKFLLKGEISEEYLSTLKPEKFRGKAYKLQELEIKFEDIVDVPGAVEAHDDWERLYKESDIAFYLIDASKIHAGNLLYEDTARGDMRHIGDWFKDRKKDPPKFFLIATHCDLISAYASLPKTRREGFFDDLWKMTVIQQLINLGGGSKYVKFAAGSLKSSDESESLVGAILRKAIE